MATVVFMRGVNVGGHRTFRPAALAKELSDLEVTSIGAAGTFVVRKKVSRTALRDAFLRRLPFEAEMVFCSARTVSALAGSDPFPRGASGRDVRRFVSVLARRPRAVPRFPLSRPSGGPWQVKVVGVQGVFALSLWRRTGKTLLYPNAVVEKELAVPATTRGWDTLVRIGKVLEEG